MTEPDATEPTARTPEPAAAEFHSRPTAEPAASPFVPRYREPWVNPARKTTALVLAAAAAVVLLALGFLLGLGVGGGHGRGFHQPIGRIVMRHPGMFGGHGYGGQRGHRMHPGFRRNVPPRGRPPAGPPAPSSRPAPRPSASPS